MKPIQNKNVLMFGTFDLLHKGHENLFKQARKLGDFITVILARDVTVKKVKSNKAVYKEGERLINLKKTGWVNKVVLGDKKDYIKLILKLKPDLICLGYDQTNFTDELERKIKEWGLNTKIVRLKSYRKNQYKSSILRNKLYAGS